MSTVYDVSVIGAANVDIIGYPQSAVQKRDSIIGHIETTFGGVGANIAINASLLGLRTRFVAAMGNDFFAEGIEQNLQSFGVDTHDCIHCKTLPAGKYMAMLDANGDMLYALNAMEINEALTKEHLRTISFAQDHFLCMDTNIPAQCLAYILETYGNTKKIIIDPVSCEKAEKLRGLEPYIFAIKPNALELEHLTGQDVSTQSNMHRAIDLLLKRGIQNVYVTNRQHKIIAANAQQYYVMDAYPTTVCNATGAGDCFTAGLVYAYHQRLHMPDCARFAAAAAALNVQAKTAVDPLLTVERIKNKIKQEA